MSQVITYKPTVIQSHSSLSFVEPLADVSREFAVRDHLEELDLHKNGKNEVCWNTDNQDHPLNWKPWPKYYNACVLIWLEFYMTLLSSSGAAAAVEIQRDDGTSSELAIFAFVSVYLIGQTLGGIFCSPFSEFFGRRTIYMIATGFFGISSVVAGVPKHVAGVFVGRFCQGVAAAIPATVAFGNFSDCFDAETRIWVVYAYTLFGMCGLALGPIFSSYVILLLDWRWVFHLAAIFSAVSLLACLFIRESNATQILQKEVKMIQKQTGSEIKVQGSGDNTRPFHDFFTEHIHRPLLFLFTEPLVTLCAVLCAIAFGLIYGLTEALTIVYTTPPFDKTFDDTSASLSFIAILIGEVLDILPRIYDAQHLKRHRKRRERITPESKIRSFAIACPALAIGLWLFAWTVPQHIVEVPFLVSMLGLVFVGFAANDFSYILFGYMTDSYGFYAASAVSAISTARTLTAAVFPLFITHMYKAIGNNFATTVWAAAATIFCFTPWIFLRYGKHLRDRSTWCDGALEDENKHLRGEDSDGHSKLPKEAWRFI